MYEHKNVVVLCGVDVTIFFFSQVYIIIALWLHIFSKLVSLVVFRCTEHEVVSELIQLEQL